MYELSSHSSARLADFYEELIQTFIQDENYVSHCNTHQLLLQDLCVFVRNKCVLPFHITTDVPEDI